MYRVTVASALPGGWQDRRRYRLSFAGAARALSRRSRHLQVRCVRASDGRCCSALSRRVRHVDCRAELHEQQEDLLAGRLPERRGDPEAAFTSAYTPHRQRPACPIPRASRPAGQRPHAGLATAAPARRCCRLWELVRGNPGTCQIGDVTRNRASTALTAERPSPRLATRRRDPIRGFPQLAWTISSALPSWSRTANIGGTPGQRRSSPTSTSRSWSRAWTPSA